ncbi:hypothetical protein [Pseudobacteriovorax antillogorgiicola]|uniref:Uncharacterized protein n=1 Tax=Pseudobacteriovorax antillogorgiicola TaxID=1513793 RepID=A0A1Y6CWT7_9BACT|nr:hypothetical protein [Pseudobacteriovorax antillogorgiicola]TCS40906.1 hypothetical protein EDD56_1525 [Pseudobacteriovorax antillogorgiicola]SMF84112.1 hypothetical protein SAMN06296036_1529 [Pseudobacteriovorax antillogorgiicola]
MKSNLFSSITMLALLLSNGAALAEGSYDYFEDSDSTHHGEDSCVVERGVNIDSWCKFQYGSSWRAKLNGADAYSWACALSQNNLRNVDIVAACKLQYRNVVGVDYRNFADPYSWFCKIDICR